MVAVRVLDCEVRASPSILDPMLPLALCVASRAGTCCRIFLVRHHDGSGQHASSAHVNISCSLHAAVSCRRMAAHDHSTYTEM